MKRVLSAGLVCLLLFGSGCSAFVKDIGGWDLSACADRDGFKVCKELFFDNEEKILGGKKVIDLILDRMKDRPEVMQVMETKEDDN